MKSLNDLINDDIKEKQWICKWCWWKYWKWKNIFYLVKCKKCE